MHAASPRLLPVLAAAALACAALAAGRAGEVAESWFSAYRDLEEIERHMVGLAARHPSLAELHVLGTSFEGRPIHALEISRGGELAIVLDGGHHAREWISVMVPLCIADRLVAGYDRDPRIRRILDATRIFVVPVVNPDGYVHSWTVDRAWRKNRHGEGVDLSRNYSVGWGEAGSSGDPSSPTYRGERPFSEPETRAMRTLFERAHVAAHVDFHAFSQVIVYPWSYKRDEPRDRAELAAIAERMAAAMTAAHGEPYAIRPGSELKVGASGTAIDWSYGTYGTRAFLVELRPTSRDGGGFELPPDQIEPTCDEALRGVLEVADWMIDRR